MISRLNKLYSLSMVINTKDPNSLGFKMIILISFFSFPLVEYYINLQTFMLQGNSKPMNGQ